MGRKALKPQKRDKVPCQNEPGSFKLYQNIFRHTQVRYLALSTRCFLQVANHAPVRILRTDARSLIFPCLPKLNTRPRLKSLTYRFEKKEESLKVQPHIMACIWTNGLKNRLHLMGRYLKNINRLIRLCGGFTEVDSPDHLGFKKRNPGGFERDAKVYAFYEKTKERAAGISVWSFPENESHYKELKYVLLVDTDKAVRDVYTSMLRYLGYQVTKCENGREALEVFQEKPDSYLLLLTNLDKHAMRGGDLAAEFRKVRSDMPVILYAGHPSKLAETAIDSGKVDRIIYEPLSLIGLEKAINEVLR